MVPTVTENNVYFYIMYKIYRDITNVQLIKLH